ncbi:MAG: PAS domain S-box protein, partial [Syntrophales bacterium]|nr:PAS domain S-box protein [Syntrophales bacterium]
MVREKRRKDRPLRIRAEEALRERAKRHSFKEIADPQALIEELRIHQVELELQNEDLRQAQQELDSSMRRYYDLYDLAPVAYITTDKKGIIQRINAAAARLLAVDKKMAPGKRFACFLSKESEDAYYVHLREIIKKIRKKRRVELKLTPGYNAEIIIVCESVALVGEAEEDLLIRSALIDITELRKAREALAAANETLERRVAERTAELQKTNLKLKNEIRARNHLRDALADAEAQAQIVTENALEAIFIAQDIKITPLNARLEEITGYPKEVLTSRQFTDFIHPDDREMVLENHKKRLRGEALPNSYEFRFTDAAGRIKWVELATVPIDWKNRPATLNFVSDVTERRDLHEALRKSETAYRTIFETTGTAMVIIEDDFTISLINYKAEELLEGRKDEIEGILPWTGFVAREDKDRLERYHRLRRSDPGAALREYEFTLVGKSGQRRTIHAVIDLIPRTKQSIVSLQDVTERRAIEERLKKSEAKYKELVQNANSIILRFDTDLNVTFFNEYAQYFFDFSEEEILGKNLIGTIVPQPDSEGVSLETKLKDVVAHPERYGQSENENMRKNGERVWIAWTNKAIRNEKGKIAEILSIGNDITHRKIMDEALKASREELQRLSNRLVIILEDERRKIAHDLHDDIGQTLSVIKYGIETTSN